MVEDVVDSGADDQAFFLGLVLLGCGSMRDRLAPGLDLAPPMLDRAGPGDDLARRLDRTGPPVVDFPPRVDLAPVTEDPVADEVALVVDVAAEEGAAADEVPPPAVLER